MKVIDATDLILGRMASSIAADLMRGEKVAVVNAEECIITGRKRDIINRYKERRQRKSLVNPARHGPFFPRRPEGIIRRAVRGMVPYKKANGKKAYKNLRVYLGVPEELAGAEKLTVEGAHLSKLKVPKYIKLKDLSRELGADF
ncbi:MAG: 50S ribosomal protein L13 [Euryarchaeota archaeon]|nr:50S ribosomal protein L13 [Euryarchaeota archaeon]